VSTKEDPAVMVENVLMPHERACRDLKRHTDVDTAGGVVIAGAVTDTVNLIETV
jgi:hypothetical protein